jgi:Tfp pilus assembly protein PilF
MLKAQGKYKDAEPFLIEAVEINRKLVGDEHPDMAHYLNNLSGLYSRQGKLGKADSTIRLALAIYEKALGHFHPTVANTLHNVAVTVYKQSHYHQADSVFREALKIWEKTLPPDHWHNASTKSWIGQCSIDLKRYREAETFLLPAYNTLKVKGGDMESVAQIALDRLIKLYKAWNKSERAAEYSRLLPKTETDPEPSKK